MLSRWPVVHDCRLLWLHTYFASSPALVQLQPCSLCTPREQVVLKPSMLAQAAAGLMTNFELSADVEAPQSPSHLDHHDPFLSGASTPVAGAAPADRQLQGPGLHGRQGPPPLEMAAAAQRFALSAQQAGAGSHQGSASPDIDQQRNNQDGSVDTSTASAHIMAGAGHAALASSQLRRRISDSTGGQQQEVRVLLVRGAMQSPSTGPGGKLSVAGRQATTAATLHRSCLE